jgi:hypothetical protein
MHKMNKRKDEYYKFCYAGDLDSINLDTLLDSQYQFKHILDEIQRELYKENKLEIKVVATQKGSFELKLLLNLV